MFFAVGALMISLFSSYDSILPKNRDDGITLKEFVENYDNYEEALNEGSNYILSDEGTWQERPNSDAIIIIGDADHVRADFTYSYDENGNLLGIHYSDRWNDAQYLPPVPNYCLTALYALLGSRPGSSHKDLIEAEALITSEIYNKLYEQSKQENLSGEFTVNDVRVSWNIVAGEIDFLTDMSLMVSLEELFRYELDFHIEIIR